MPRNRMIKADFWSDEKIGLMSSDAKLLFIGMWNFSDDSGTCRANPAYLKAQIFPYSNISLENIQKLLNELLKNNLVDLVQQRGEHYCVILNFNKHQTIKNPSKFRYIDDTNPILTQSYLHLPLKEKEKGKEKEKCQNAIDSSQNNFDLEMLYQKYPKKIGKKSGMEKLKKIITSQDIYDEVSQAIDNYRDELEINQTEMKYTKQFSTFVNNWEDYKFSNGGDNDLTKSKEAWARIKAKTEQTAKDTENIFNELLMG